MTKLGDLERKSLEERISKLEGQLSALSLVLHLDIIMSDDVLRRHRSGILQMLDGLAASRASNTYGATLREWIGVLRSQGGKG